MMVHAGILGDGPAPDWTGPLVASGNLRRRSAFSRAIVIACLAAAAAAVALMALVVFDVGTKGAGVLGLSFVFTNPQGGYALGGIGNMLLGTAEIVAIGAAIAIPIGVTSAILLTEFVGPRSRFGRAVKLTLDLLQGLPTIVTALFIYGLVVIPTHKETGFAASLALAIVMLPLVARSSQEVLELVPGSLREAADALGVDRWRAVLTVILPSAVGGIATGAILAISRAAGETAPVLICDSIWNPVATQLNPFQGVPNVPLFIFTVSGLSVDTFARAWGAAFVLLGAILLANIVARLLLARSRRRLGV